MWGPKKKRKRNVKKAANEAEKRRGRGRTKKTLTDIAQCAVDDRRVRLVGRALRPPRQLRLRLRQGLPHGVRKVAVVPRGGGLDSQLDHVADAPPGSGRAGHDDGEGRGGEYRGGASPDEPPPGDYSGVA